MKKKTFAVIGLGKFGTAVAERLYELGNEVLAIDVTPELVQRVESKVTCAAVCDCRDEQVLRSLGVGSYDCAIVAIGTDLAASVITTLNLKELGVKRVICKALDETQKRALEKIGADKVLIPEKEAGYKLAQAAVSSDILDFIELSGNYGIADVKVPKSWIGKSLRELNVRARFGVNVIALRKNGQLIAALDANAPLQEDTVMVLMGKNDDLAELEA